jgi:NAD+ diphosphatase
MTFEYCPKCGKKLVPKECGDDGNIPFCENCQRPFFPFSYPCVICLCVTEETNEAVLIKQAYVSDHYVQVAGYIKEGETPEEAAAREIYEEVGLDASEINYIGSFYHEKSGNLMLGYACKVKKEPLRLSSEVDSGDFFTFDEGLKLLKHGSIAYKLLDLYTNKELRK